MSNMHINFTSNAKEQHEQVKLLDEAMKALAKSANIVPIARVEWLAIAFIASQTIGNVGILLIAVALLRGHH